MSTVPAEVGAYLEKTAFRSMSQINHIPMSQHVAFSKNLVSETDALVEAAGADRVFVLTDETTERLCRPLLSPCRTLQSVERIVIGAGDACKNLETLSRVWLALSQGGASRRSLLLCLGGGMVTDLGGFAASTFKRGIRYVNIPTTLLSMVDAAVGGKTGINFNGLKNEIGAFNSALAVVIDTDFLRTLDRENLCSGYAEMLKHGLISSTEMWRTLLDFDLSAPDYAHLQALVADSIGVKERIVAEDPREKGLRKALNLGHTAGHALESFALAEQRPVLHGYAVAWGLVCELYLSTVKKGFPENMLRQTVAFVREHYGRFAFGCNDYDRLLELMRHDKKNVNGVINFTLLEAPGKICLDQTASKEEICESFDFFRESLG